MNRAELGARSRAELTRLRAKSRAAAARFESELSEFTAWTPPLDLPRNEQGVRTLTITDPFEVEGIAIGTRYERAFILASVGAAELGEPFNLCYRGLSITANPGDEPEQLMENQGSWLGNSICFGSR